VISPSFDDFYYLARLTLVKDEAHFDKFDRAFGLYFKGIQAAFETERHDTAGLAGAAHEARTRRRTARRWKSTATTS
jgi:uncharacterized protein with von Willebrand factor type A (vWA) domain